MSWLKLTLVANSLRIAKAICVRDKESNPCSMNVAEVLICERSRPETGSSSSSTREAMRSLRDAGEFCEVSVAIEIEEVDELIALPTVTEPNSGGGRLGTAVAGGAGSIQKRCRSKG